MQQHLFVTGAVEFGVIGDRPTVRGECDISNAAEVERWLNSFGRAAIDVDLSGVTFFDASSLAAFLRAWHRNPNMRIVEPSPAVRRILEITETSPCLLDGIEVVRRVGQTGAPPRVTRRRKAIADHQPPRAFGANGSVA